MPGVIFSLVCNTGDEIRNYIKSVFYLRAGTRFFPQKYQGAADKWCRLGALTTFSYFADLL